MFVLPKHQAACVLMFHLQKDEFPVDTHVSSHENYRCYSFTLVSFCNHVMQLMQYYA